MDRREALSMVSLVCGGTIAGAAGFLSGCKENKPKSIMGILDNSQQNILEELAETILPKTSNSPGAKDVEIGKFANRIVTDCYTENEQNELIDGLLKLDEISQLNYNDKFIKLSIVDKNELILKLESESKTSNQTRQNEAPPHYYSMMKQLSVWGYLSSEIVGTKVMRFVPIPGRFEGCIPYETGEKVFS